MSCYKIEYNQAGAKILVPVLSREEYLRLRSYSSHEMRVAQVREGNVSAKRRLLQFNYSCIPDESGLLKGNKVPSTSFGMDIDHIAPAEMGKLAEKILAKKEELGLLMLERSVRCEGYHLVLKRNPEYSQVENLKNAAEILGVEYDEGAKDITRVFYATTDSPEDLLYLDDELFTNEASKEVKQKKETVIPSPSLQVKSEENGLSPFSLKAFDLCRIEAGLSEEDLDKEGSRHNNLKAILSVGLCQLVPQVELLAVVKAKMPGYYADGNDAEILVKNFYENYCDHNGRMSLTLRKIYSEAQKVKVASSEGEFFEPDEKKVELPPLPRLLQLLVKAYPEEYRPAVVMSSLVFLGTLLSKLRAFYLDGAAHSPSFLCCVTAPQASGKSFTRRLYELLTEPIKLNDQIGRKLEREYNDKKKSAKNSRQQPEDPKALIRLIPATASNAMILKRADYANGLHLCTYAEEIDTLVKGQKAGAWSEKSDLYRMAFDNAEWGQDYMSDNSYSGQVKLFYNLLVCGTPNAMNRFFKDVEDGLVSRVMFVQLPDMLGSKMPKFGYYSHQELAEIKETVKKLWEMGSSLTPNLHFETSQKPPKGEGGIDGEGKKSFPSGGDLEEASELWIDSPELIDALDQWLEEKRQMYLQNQDNPALEVFRRRAGVCGFRAGMIAYAMNGMKWSKDCEEFALWVAEFTLQNQLALFGEKMNQVMLEQEKDERYHGNSSNFVSKNHRLLDELPQEFSYTDVMNYRLAYGQTGKANYVICRWVKNGLVVKVDENTWRKV